MSIQPQPWLSSPFPGNPADRRRSAPRGAARLLEPHAQRAVPRVLEVLDLEGELAQRLDAEPAQILQLAVAAEIAAQIIAAEGEIV